MTNFKVLWTGKIERDRYVIADVESFGVFVFVAKPYKKLYSPMSKNLIEFYEEFIQTANGIVPDNILEMLKQEIFIEKL